MTEKMYKVHNNNGTNYIAMPADANPYYIRRICHDGTVTFLPVKMPVSCQSMEQRGDVPK